MNPTYPMTKAEQCNARVLRFLTISGLVTNGHMTEAQARDVLRGPLNPDDLDTVVDDSALLGNADAISIIVRDLYGGEVSNG